MSNLGNREVFAKNLKFYAEKSGKTQKELSEIVGVATSTFNDWMKARKYPRMDKIEILANYFRILKSDLIEDKHKQSTNQEVVQLSQQKQEFIKRVESMSDEQLDILEKLLDVVENKG